MVGEGGITHLVATLREKALVAVRWGTHIAVTILVTESRMPIFSLLSHCHPAVSHSCQQGRHMTGAGCGKSCVIGLLHNSRRKLARGKPAV